MKKIPNRQNFKETMSKVGKANDYTPYATQKLQIKL